MTAQALVSIWIVASLALWGCSGKDGATDAKIVKNDGAGHTDINAIVGKQPPTIDDCTPPSPTGISKDKYYCFCTGYLGGGPPTKACQGLIGDCRVFYDSCIPASYTRCDQNAPDLILGLCGYCFFREAGGIPASCNKLPDSGGAKPKDAGAAQ